MNPATVRAGVLAADCIEWQFGTPNSRSRPGEENNGETTFTVYETCHQPFVDFLDVRREDPRLHISTPSSEQDIVGVPVHGKHSRPDRLLQMLRNPPVVLGVERANRDGAIHSIGGFRPAS